MWKGESNSGTVDHLENLHAWFSRCGNSLRTMALANWRKELGHSSNDLSVIRHFGLPNKPPNSGEVMQRRGLVALEHGHHSGGNLQLRSCDNARRSATISSRRFSRTSQIHVLHSHIHRLLPDSESKPLRPDWTVTPAVVSKTRQREPETTQDENANVRQNEDAQQSHGATLRTQQGSRRI